MAPNETNSARAYASPDERTQSSPSKKQFEVKVIKMSSTNGSIKSLQEKLKAEEEKERKEL